MNAAYGSSPLARGLLTALPQQVLAAGIIPARAGFTRPLFGNLLQPSDHPRSRGVYLQEIAHETPDIGSSPLARGLQRPLHDRTADTRIIPARAGFTIPRPTSFRAHRDHPRSRGVYSPFHSPFLYVAGSSPLARGLLFVITSSPHRVRDHPRSRGVYTCGKEDVMRTGSSPLARGLRGRLVQHLCGAGDHPRSRGVYLCWLCAGLGGQGSSPLARGLPGPISPSSSSRLDHPRSRGVYTVSTTSTRGTRGSSPLARGLR